MEDSDTTHQDCVAHRGRNRNPKIICPNSRFVPNECKKGNTKLKSGETQNENKKNEKNT